MPIELRHSEDGSKVIVDQISDPISLKRFMDLMMIYELPDHLMKQYLADIWNFVQSYQPNDKIVKFKISPSFTGSSGFLILNSENEVKSRIVCFRG